MDQLKNTQSQNVVVHEVGHKIALNQLKDLDGNLTSSGKRMLEGFKELVPKEQRKIIEKALGKNYNELPKDKQLEEFFTIFSEKLADGEIVLPGEMRKVEGLKNPSDLFNLVRRLQDNLRRVAEGTTDKLDANLIEAIELGAKNAKVEGAQYKKIEFDYAKNGTIGLESAFGALNTLFTTKKAVQLLTKGKSRFGLDTTSIKIGCKADLSLFNPSETYVFEDKHIRSKSKNSLFKGSKLKGTVYGIIANNTTSIAL